MSSLLMINCFFLVGFFSSLFFFESVIFLVGFLLGFIMILVGFFSSLFFISTLTCLMLLVVYAGGVMIFIGYVCAVCPNVNVSSLFYKSKMLVSILTLIFVFFCFYLLDFKMNLLVSLNFQEMVSFKWVLSNFFYSFSGFISFFLVLIVFMFLVLLMVTSQFFSPKGPFRSL